MARGQTPPPAPLLAFPAQLRFTDANVDYSQSIAVTSEGDQFGVAISADGGNPNLPAPAWLELGTRSLTTPGRLRVGIGKPPAAGTYTARILFRPRVDAVVAPTIVNVSLELKLTQTPFTVTPASLRFIGQVGGFVPGQYLLLPRGVACRDVVARVDAQWLSIAPEPIADCNRFLVSTRVSTGNPGAYRAIITMTYQNTTVRVPVTGFVIGAGGWLDVNPDGFQFEVREGNGNPITRNLAVFNRGAGTLNWTVRDVFGPTDWLSLGAVSGTASANADGRIPITVTPGRLPEGAYHAVLEVSAPGARNSPELFVIALRVAAAASGALSAPSPSGLIFNVVEGSGPSEQQAVTIFTSNTGAAQFRAWPQPRDEGAGWLLVSSQTGTTSTGTPGRVGVWVRPGTLRPGVYTGELNTYVVVRGGTEIRAVNVTMIVRPAVATRAASQRAAEGCTPTKLAPTHTGLVNNFATRIGWPTPINLRVVDDCGDPVNGAQAILSFSNGDPPLVLTNLLNGNYAGTWVPRVPATDTMTIRADAAQATLSGSIELSGRINTTATPIVFPDGLVSPFDRQKGGPSAPGSWVEIYGSNLAGGIAFAKLDNNRLPDTVGDVSVVVGTTRVPLLFASPDQVNAQIPIEAAVDQTAPVVLKSGSALSVPVRIPVISQQPGLLATTDGKLRAHAQNFVEISAANPARRGRPIILYLVGMGVTSPTTTTGSVAPGQPLASVTNKPEVILAGKPVPVLFAGLTPGFVGLYQINIIVPADATPGEQRLVVTQGGVSSNEVQLQVQ